MKTTKGGDCGRGDDEQERRLPHDDAGIGEARRSKKQGQAERAIDDQRFRDGCDERQTRDDPPTRADEHQQTGETEKDPADSPLLEVVRFVAGERELLEVEKPEQSDVDARS